MSIDVLVRSSKITLAQISLNRLSFVRAHGGWPASGIPKLKLLTWLRLIYNGLLIE